MKTRLALLLLVAACGRTNSEENGASSSDSLSIIAPFSGPESVQYYPEGDEYFVSNVHGDMTVKDDNGFISRVSPNGHVIQLKWIDGATLPVTLHAPKGIVTHGDPLFVADLDTVRAFSISTGSPMTAATRGVPQARFLNDLTISPAGVLYASESGLKTGMLPTTSDAVYRFDARRPVPVAKGTWLSRPNGIAVGPEGLTVATFGSRVLIRFRQPGSNADTVATLIGGSLDGLIRLDSANFLVSSWDTKTIYHVDLIAKRAHPLYTGMETPADIGYDTKRKRVLIPLVSRNRIEVRRAP